MKWGILIRSKEGGLGLRNLEIMNRAMIVKNIWKVVAGDSTLWVQIMQAKYYPSGSFWTTNKMSTCTRLWKAMMQNKPLLANYTSWVLGNGLTVGVFNQPWFLGWRQCQMAGRHLTNTKVASLFDLDTLSWNLYKLIECFGEQMATEIEAQLRGKILYPNIEDKLMFTWANNGEFMVKKAYRMLEQLQFLNPEMTSDRDKFLWSKV